MVHHWCCAIRSERIRIIRTSCGKLPCFRIYRREEAITLRIFYDSTKPHCTSDRIQPTFGGRKVELVFSWGGKFFEYTVPQLCKLVNNELLYRKQGKVFNEFNRDLLFITYCKPILFGVYSILWNINFSRS